MQRVDFFWTNSHSVPFLLAHPSRDIYMLAILTFDRIVRIDRLPENVSSSQNSLAILSGQAGATTHKKPCPKPTLDVGQGE
jgi:hypothetical protein